jgi:hypothetical protein
LAILDLKDTNPSYYNSNVNYTITNSGYIESRLSGYNTIRFNSDNTIKFTTNTSVQLLIVGGGGAGGGSSGNLEGGGGGGAGSVGIGTFTFLANQTYSITIGAGGTSTNSTTNTSGGNTIIKLGTTTIFQAIGGGKGTGNSTPLAGENGGSGGGASNVAAVNPLGGTVTPNSYTGITFYGNNGGQGLHLGNGGGGGGAGTASSATSGIAGSGRTWTITGTLIFGQGGYGGNGQSTANYIPSDITNISGYGGKSATPGGNAFPANSGNGGGGAGAQGNSLGGNGASGCFIIAF